MKKVYLITLEDISVSPCGYNIVIHTKGGDMVNFTQEAFDKFAKDVETLRVINRLPKEKDKYEH